ncbi:hypothetical protein GCM10010347_17860 [Streptomyces cirratus]|uniref:Uncharacterized protein n=1 Tax=Streptomyces cirratus TaxID=68187 RepID=A0ABQ3ESG1_9ACTN|nr:hypothetical protein GCM10010347_17860 [Streptomyces cirratus]
MVVPVFFTVHLPSKPEPQSETFVYVAVAEPAAWAGPARATSPAAGRAKAATAAASLRKSRVRGGGAVLKVVLRRSAEVAGPTSAWGWDLRRP